MYSKGARAGSHTTSRDEGIHLCLDTEGKVSRNVKDPVDPSLRDALAGRRVVGLAISLFLLVGICLLGTIISIAFYSHP
jgi:hypothetical protein